MDRLTVRRSDGRFAIANKDGATPTEQVLKIPMVINRLAAYEETGLEPEEIHDQLESMVDAVALFFEISPNRLRELVRADKGGISPCTFCRFNPPSSGDGKPCCMCPAAAALRREQDG